MHKKRWFIINNAYFIYIYDDYFRQKNCKRAHSDNSGIINNLHNLKEI